jgi:hypothetical protein
MSHYPKSPPDDLENKKSSLPPPPPKPSPQKTPKETVETWRVGPKLEMAGIKAKHINGYYVPEIQVSNTSDIGVSAYFLSGSIFLSDSENNLENEDVNNMMNINEDNAKKAILVSGDQLQVTRGMGMSMPLSNQFSDSEIELVTNGSKKMYVVLIAIYKTPKTPKDRMWVTEICARVSEPFEGFQSCPSHNKIFYSDRFLNKID